MAYLLLRALHGYTTANAAESLARRCCCCCCCCGHHVNRPRALRSESTAASEDLAPVHEVDSNASIPLVPRKRDPHALLKALSSTLSPLPHPLMLGGRSLADPMVPRTRTVQVDYQRAHEAGRKAAEYVINRWPQMFPYRQQNAEQLHQKEAVAQELSEDTLKDLVARRQTGRAMKTFQKLQEKGHPVSLETQNSLLELLSYHGVGNHKSGGRSAGRVEEEEVEEERGEALLPPEGEAGMLSSEIAKEVVEGQEGRDRRQEEEGALWERMETKGGGDGKEAAVSGVEKNARDRTHLLLFNNDLGKTWSVMNCAEKLFAEMTERDGGTYDALILGLAKFREYARAWSMFEEMRKEGHQASTATYNSLLFVIGNTHTPQPWDKATALLKHMNQNPAVRPDITTMNLMLEISCQTGSDSSRQLSLKVIREALHLGLEPNLTTFLVLLRAHLKCSNGSILYDITDYLEKNQHIIKISDPQDIYFFPAAMTTARMMLDHELAMRLRRLADKDNWMLCQNIVFFVSHYLMTIAGRVPAETLRGEYNSFVPWVVVPMERVYGVLFRACEEQLCRSFAMEMWNDIAKYHIKVLNVTTLTRLCGALTRKVHPIEVDSVLKVLLEVWKRTTESEIEPSPFMISQVIRMYCMNLDMEQAWKFYQHFEDYGLQPTFIALSSLVRGYANVPDAKRTEQVLGIMLQRGLQLPATFVRDNCWRAGVDNDTRAQLLAGFAQREEDQSSVRQSQS